MLLNELDYPAVGTLMKSRRNVPKFSEKLNRGNSQFRVNNEGTIVCRWQDTKDVFAISNCFSDATTDGTRKDVPCPAMLQFYNPNMGGVDLTDQIVGLYDFDRKSGKWWKKVFCKLLMVAVANAHVLYNDLHWTQTAFLPFLIQAAEGLVSLGRSKAAVKRSSAASLGRPPKVKKRKTMFNVGDHLPIQGKTRGRYTAKGIIILSNTADFTIVNSLRAKWPTNTKISDLVLPDACQEVISGQLFPKFWLPTKDPTHMLTITNGSFQVAKLQQIPTLI
ncbi:hypothetical protein ILUMI_20831 [Ignelater luminosus]|uniref:PiggyBac transposable element-derived protein domain-containing protein n=1 Tax=Ignelater luminosus TaxID=2038154 RepID=A0A8K0CHJ9_IGNLU|nr:hypothetical protein ILUMI_20831 [Ignelater luminosus]